MAWHLLKGNRWQYFAFSYMKFKYHGSQTCIYMWTPHFISPNLFTRFYHHIKAWKGKSNKLSIVSFLAISLRVTDNFHKRDFNYVRIKILQEQTITFFLVFKIALFLRCVPHIFDVSFVRWHSIVVWITDHAFGNHYCHYCTAAFSPLQEYTHWGCNYHLAKKIRKFRLKVKWIREFPENPFGNCIAKSS